MSTETEITNSFQITVKYHQYQIQILVTMVTGSMIELHHSSTFVFQANKEYNKNQLHYMESSAERLVLHILMMYLLKLKRNGQMFQFGQMVDYQ